MRSFLDYLRTPSCIVSFVIVISGAFIVTELDLLSESPRGLKNWEGGEIISLFMVLSLSLLLLLLLRRNRALELAHRQTAEAEADAQRIALHDPLTELPNWRFFHEHVETRLARTRRGDSRAALAVLLLNLDRFKLVNDLRGHQVGDRLLCEVANRLRRACPKNAMVARLGGDEFVVTLWSQHAEAHGCLTAQLILEALREPFEFGDWEVAISCSIGIADWSTGVSSSGLLRHADQAMYRAKQAGRNGYAHYDDVTGKATQDRAALEVDLRQAVDQGAITPYFQPIHDVRTRELRGFEVLARWNDPSRGFVSPEVFVGLAEEIGLIDRLSSQLLDNACALLASWPTELPISFNLSPRQFGDASLPRRILKILKRHGLSGSRLEIEITESAVMADMDMARQIIGELAAGGVLISLDDFGAGTSSLALLMQLPIDSLKIDRSFIAEVDRQPTKGKIVSGVLSLAQSLGLKVTAEGIERPEELAFLQERQCALAQGFLLGRPQPAASIKELLSKAAPPALLVPPQKSS